MPDTLTPPIVSEELAIKVIAKNYGFQPVSIKRLNSYVDLNFLIQNQHYKKFVLKISHAEQEYEQLEGQHLMLNLLKRNNQFPDCFPQVISTLEHQEIIYCIDQNNNACATRLLSYLEGDLFTNADYTKALLYEFGEFLGTVTKTVYGTKNTALQINDSVWDLKNALYNLDYLASVTNPQNRRLADYFLLQFEEYCLPHLRTLRKGIIHGDANDYNVLVKNGSIAGLIDFGDVSYSSVVFEPAIALAYAMQNRENPMEVATDFIRGYHQHFPLEELEISLLYYLIAARLCTSVIMAAYSRKLDPGNEYISVSERPGWALLHQLLAINPIYFEQQMRKACSFEVPELTDYSKEITLRKKYLAPSLGLSYPDTPLKISKGGLQYLYGKNGKTYLDGVNNICHVGHCHPTVVRSGQRQIARLNTNTRYIYDSLNEYAEQLIAKFPKPLNQVFFVNSGSEATELALRLARTHTKRWDVMVVDGAYHGNSGSGIAISPYKFEGKGGFGQLSWVHKVAAPDIYRGQYKKSDNAGSLYANDVATVLKKLESDNTKIAAWFCESLLGCGGQIVLPDGYLQQVYKSIRAHGGVCIADEVQVGFGRVGATFWGFELQQVVPDIVIFGKPVGNGHPMAGVVTTNEIANSFNNGMEYFSSFGGNPVSCEIGRAVLDVIEEEGLQQHAFELGNYLLAGFEHLKSNYDLIGDVRGVGLFLGIELVRNHETLEAADIEATIIVDRLKDKGILLSIDGPLHNVIKFKPPMVFSKTNADCLLATLDSVFEHL